MYIFMNVFCLLILDEEVSFSHVDKKNIGIIIQNQGEGEEDVIITEHAADEEDDAGSDDNAENVNRNRFKKNSFDVSTKGSLYWFCPWCSYAPTEIPET